MFFLLLIILDASPFYERGFIVSNDTAIAMHDILPNGGQPIEIIYIHVPGNIIESFAVDANSDIIYFLDMESSSLKQYDMRLKQLRTLDSISTSRGIAFVQGQSIPSCYFYYKSSIY